MYVGTTTTCTAAPRLMKMSSGGPTCSRPDSRSRLCVLCVAACSVVLRVVVRRAERSQRSHNSAPKTGEKSVPPRHTGRCLLSFITKAKISWETAMALRSILASRRRCRRRCPSARWQHRPQRTSTNRPPGPPTTQGTRTTTTMTR